MISDICVVINAGLDGCTSSSLLPRTTSPASIASPVLNKCIYPPAGIAEKIKEIVNNITSGEKAILRVINLTLHDYSWLKSNANANMNVLNVLGSPWELICVDCGLVIDYRKTKTKYCPHCGGKLKAKIKLLGDKLNAEDIKNLLWVLSGCDQIIIIGEEPKLEPLKTTLEAITKYWNKNIRIEYLE
ncbi:Sir2 family NAD-dependent protein deacetylase [Thermofilum sp.]|uniref:Sir2 family NAD-dependent protein deacetylase n=1 Tax=Thermofilum sp. TaxID=1961369 RepID=UPI00258E6C30|nr:Sir2 family NAD-dependent protein deacetylase [Thermofilum sp.]